MVCQFVSPGNCCCQGRYSYNIRDFIEGQVFNVFIKDGDIIVIRSQPGNCWKRQRDHQPLLAEHLSQLNMRWVVDILLML